MFRMLLGPTEKENGTKLKKSLPGLEDELEEGARLEEEKQKKAAFLPQGLEHFVIKVCIHVLSYIKNFNVAPD